MPNDEKNTAKWNEKKPQLIFLGFRFPRRLSNQLAGVYMLAIDALIQCFRGESAWTSNTRALALFVHPQDQATDENRKN